MTKNVSTKATEASTKPSVEKIATPIPSKHSQVVAMLSRDGGASLEEMSAKAKWLIHSTRAFLTGLKKKGYVLDSEKVTGVRRYRITKSPAS